LSVFSTTSVINISWQSFYISQISQWRWQCSTEWIHTHGPNSSEMILILKWGMKIIDNVQCCQWGEISIFRRNRPTQWIKRQYSNIKMRKIVLQSKINVHRFKILEFSKWCWQSSTDLILWQIPSYLTIKNNKKWNNDHKKNRTIQLRVKDFQSKKERFLLVYCNIIF